MSTNARKEMTKKSYIFLYVTMGAVYLVLPFLLSFINFGDKREFVMECSYISAAIIVFSALLIPHRSRASRTLNLLCITFILTVSLLTGSLLMSILRSYTIDWPRSLFNLVTMVPIALLVGILVIWKTSQPTPKQSVDEELD